MNKNTDDSIESKINRNIAPENVTTVDEGLLLTKKTVLGEAMEALLKQNGYENKKTNH